ncbi:MAG: hypothetical protein EAX86_01535 [Candidatus Heimdallarchaeota archaeon]|nr:hypothetical protein [Candidatus Heimdallarchaeota archaeon]
MSAHEVIEIIEQTFTGIDIAACISIVDSDGLVIYSTGTQCEEQTLLESLNAYLIMSFESTLNQLIALNQILDSLIINTGDAVFYIDDLRGSSSLYIIIRTTPILLNKVLPFLKNFVRTLEKTLQDLG